MYDSITVLIEKRAWRAYVTAAFRRDDMTRPKMIFFDFGETLVTQEDIDGEKGTAEVLKYAVENRYNLTARQVQDEADRINTELGRLDPAKRANLGVEIPNHMFTAYLYESLGIKLRLSAAEIDRIFWNAASEGRPTPGAPEMLNFLWRGIIRTAVISNISYTGKIVTERINRILPNNHFEFVISTSEYLFRKPNPRIFRLAMERAHVAPEDVWYIGDDYDCDVVGARNAGMLPIWYKDRNNKAADRDDVITINDWEDLKAIIRECTEPVGDGTLVNFFAND